MNIESAKQPIYWKNEPCPHAILFADIDGVLTNGQISVIMSEGAVLPSIGVQYSTKDGHAISELQERGVKVIFVTRSPNPCHAYRAQFLGVSLFVSKNKSKVVQSVLLHTLNRYGKIPSICAIGDNQFDIKMLEFADIAGCPSNSHPKMIKYIKKRRGVVIDAINNPPGISCFAIFSERVIEQLKLHTIASEIQ